MNCLILDVIRMVTESEVEWLCLPSCLSAESVSIWQISRLREWDLLSAPAPIHHSSSTIDRSTTVCFPSFLSLNYQPDSDFEGRCSSPSHCTEWLVFWAGDNCGRVAPLLARLWCFHWQISCSNKSRLSPLTYDSVLSSLITWLTNLKLTLHRSSDQTSKPPLNNI